MPQSGIWSVYRIFGWSQTTAVAASPRTYWQSTWTKEPKNLKFCFNAVIWINSMCSKWDGCKFNIGSRHVNPQCRWQGNFHFSRRRLRVNKLWAKIWVTTTNKYSNYVQTIISNTWKHSNAARCSSNPGQSSFEEFIKRDRPHIMSTERNIEQLLHGKLYLQPRNCSTYSHYP